LFVSQYFGYYTDWIRLVTDFIKHIFLRIYFTHFYLGKTLIAAVVMYNFFRWYPRGKIIFMAPTKPLVAQQIQACYEIMGLPFDSTSEMTGAMSPADRKTQWREKRVFFLTPQILTNDISRAAFPASEIKCLVLDEAHKALGNYAYVQVVQELCNHGAVFRILALSATPGNFF
jgi:Fanconi anemia group M protein